MTEPVENRKVRVEIGKILEILPQRYPFVMVDRVTDLHAGVSISGHKMVSFNEPWCQGHLPRRPLLPGVLILEALSQLGAILVYATEPFAVPTNMLYFLGIDKVKFRNTVTPGDRLDLAVEIIEHKSNVWRLKGEASVEGTLCARGEFLASVVDSET